MRQYPLLPVIFKWYDNVCTRTCVNGINLRSALGWHVHIIISSFRTMPALTRTHSHANWGPQTDRVKNWYCPEFCWLADKSHVYKQRPLPLQSLRLQWPRLLHVMHCPHQSLHHTPPPPPQQKSSSLSACVHCLLLLKWQPLHCCISFILILQQDNCNPHRTHEPSSPLM